MNILKPTELYLLKWYVLCELYLHLKIDSDYKEPSNLKMFSNGLSEDIEN